MASIRSERTSSTRTGYAAQFVLVGVRVNASDLGSSRVVDWSLHSVGLVSSGLTISRMD